MKKKKKSLSTMPDGSITIGFDSDMAELSLSQIVPIKVVPAAAQTSSKYKQILASIREVGIIEPPVVAPEGRSKQRFILLDGHMRIQALKDLGIDTVACLVSSDDEAFTYNKHVSRISPIQEHRMIRRAIERGVSEEKLAKVLDLDVARIVLRKNLLEGICQEASDMLKDKMVAIDVFPILRRMKPYRQIEAVMLMNDTGTYSAAYARTLLITTPKDQLTQPDKPKNIKGLTEEQVARAEHEMANVQREYQLIKDNYGADVLHLTLAKGYLGKLLGNVAIVRYLAQHHSDLLHEFQKIVDAKSLAGDAA
ncbi:MAG: chromosome partitioning protein ParB [Azospirillum brasilense]|nr:MAG: chromosome partitioning protein ParB [Azospirillum brasilense]